MKNTKTVTVFGSSIPAPGEPEYEVAYELGLKLGKNGFNVCTGGYNGIMDAVSKGASEAGTEAIGVTVKHLFSTPSRYLTKNIVTDSLFDRITRLVETGDAYIILEGGTGTLLELSVIWEYMNKGIMIRKPAACCGSMWNSIVSLVDERMETEKRARGLIRRFDTAYECAEYIIDRIK